MNDDELFGRLAAHARPAEVDPRFDDRLYALLQGEMRRNRRSTRMLVLLAAALLLVAAIGSGILVASRMVEPAPLPESAAPRLAYGLDGDIYLAEWDGANPVRVADGIPFSDDGFPECETYYPSGEMWAPNGLHFAYRSRWDDECRGEVHVRDADGRLVASVPGTGWDVSWSPDSTRFVTWIDLSRTIGVYGVDGTTQAILTLPPQCRGSGDHDPQWTPDDTLVIAYWPCEIPVDGGEPQLLVSTDTGDEAWGSWSPDGSRVAHVAMTTVSGQTTDSALVIAEANGTVLMAVEDESARAPWYHDIVWAPSGDRVAFGWTRVSSAGFPSAGTQVQVADIGSGRVTTIAAEAGIQPIRFSPDGDRILYATRDNEGAAALWSMNADGSGTRLLVSDTDGGDWQPVTGPAD